MVGPQPELSTVRQSDRLAAHQSSSYPTRVPPAIEDSKNHNRVFDEAVIDSEGKPLREQAVVSKNHLVDASEVCQGVNVGIEGVEEIRSEAGRLRLIKSVSFLKVFLGRGEDSYSHETFF